MRFRCGSVGRVGGGCLYSAGKKDCAYFDFLLLLFWSVGYELRGEVPCRWSWIYIMKIFYIAISIASLDEVILRVREHDRCKETSDSSD